MILDVSVWLKSLRLHKYSHLFQQITYDEMMNLTEEWLEGQVTSPLSTGQLFQNCSLNFECN